MLVEEDPKDRGQSSSEVKGGEEGDRSEDEGEKDTNNTTQRILTIMANFVDGEVSCKEI